MRQTAAGEDLFFMIFKYVIQASIYVITGRRLREQTSPIFVDLTSDVNKQIETVHRSVITDAELCILSLYLFTEPRRDWYSNDSLISGRLVVNNLFNILIRMRSLVKLNLPEEAGNGRRAVKWPTTWIGNGPGYISIECYLSVSVAPFDHRPTRTPARISLLKHTLFAHSLYNWVILV